MSPNDYTLRCIQPGEVATVEGKPHLPAGHYLLTGLSRSVAAVAIHSEGCSAHPICLPMRPGRCSYVLRLERHIPDAVARLLEPSPPVQPRVVLHRLSRGVSMYLRLRARASGQRTVTMRQAGDLLRCDSPPIPDQYQAWFDELPELLMLQLETQAPRTPAQAVVDTANTGITPDHGLTTGMHMHVHYGDLWPAMRNLSCLLPVSSRIFITTDDDALAERMACDCPTAEVRLVANRGRDIAPFLQLLGEGAFDGLDAVCKLHSKKSVREGGESYCGRVWRSRLFDDLLGSRERIGEILRRFAQEPVLGMLGPDWARLPSRRVTLDSAIGSNGQAMHAMLATWPKPVALDQIEFFAGSMFWFRPAALSGLAAATQHLAFPAEPLQQVDGSPAHCLERLIPTWAKSAGYRIRSI